MSKEVYKKGSERKEIQRNIRITPSIYNYVDKFTGDGFNDKLENLIIYFMINEEKLKIDIKDKSKELEILTKKVEEKQSIVKEIRSLERKINSIYKIISEKGIW